MGSHVALYDVVLLGILLGISVSGGQMSSMHMQSGTRNQNHQVSGTGWSSLQVPLLHVALYVVVQLGICSASQSQEVGCPTCTYILELEIKNQQVSGTAWSAFGGGVSVKAGANRPGCSIWTTCA